MTNSNFDSDLNVNYIDCIFEENVALNGINIHIFTSYLRRNVTIHSNVIIEKNCVIDTNAIIGYNKPGSPEKLTIIGEKTYIAPNVIIEAGATIGSNVTINPGCYIESNDLIENNAILGIEQTTIKIEQKSKTRIRWWKSLLQKIRNRSNI